MDSSTITPILARGGFGGIIRWFIQIVIYDICITGIQEALGVSRIVACLIFLGIMLIIAAIGYVMRKKMSGHADSDI